MHYSFLKRHQSLGEVDIGVKMMSFYEDTSVHCYFKQPIQRSYSQIYLMFMRREICVPFFQWVFRLVLMAISLKFHMELLAAVWQEYNLSTFKCCC